MMNQAAPLHYRAMATLWHSLRLIILAMLLDQAMCECIGITMQSVKSGPGGS